MSTATHDPSHTEGSFETARRHSRGIAYLLGTEHSDSSSPRTPHRTRDLLHTERSAFDVQRTYPSGTLHITSSSDVLLALDKVATKNPRDRFRKGNKGLERSQTSASHTSARQTGPLFRTKSLPSSTMRADQARRAGLEALKQRKEVGHQALGAYMTTRRGDMQNTVQHYKSAKRKELQVKGETSAVMDKLSDNYRQKWQRRPPSTTPEERRQRTALLQQHNALAIREWELWNQKQGHREAGREVHRELLKLSRAGFGSLDFHHKHLARGNPDVQRRREGEISAGRTE